MEGADTCTASGLTAKYTIPEASTAPAEKADASFQFKYTPRTSALNVLNATGMIYVSNPKPLK
jgi:hypothetical protein